MGKLTTNNNVIKKDKTIQDKQPKIAQYNLIFLLMMISFVIGMFWLLIICDKNQCSFTHWPNLNQYTNLETYFNLNAYFGFFLYTVIIAVISVIPIMGEQVPEVTSKSSDNFIFIMNGTFSCFFLLSIGIALQLNKIPIFEFIIDHIFHFFCISMIFGLILSVYVYIRSFYMPINALNVLCLGKGIIYEFYMGREISPRLFGVLDLKVYINRLAVIGPFLINCAILYKSLFLTKENSINIHPTLILLIICHSIYFLDPLIREVNWVTSFEIQYEGLGFMGCVGYLVFPFMAISATQYIYYHNINLPLWYLILIGCVFTTGYIFYRGANVQKDLFRKNPNDPAVSHLEAISTSKGKKLICSGFWGIVRHPNYLGDILMNAAIGLFVINSPPVLSNLIEIGLLTHRTGRDHEKCKEKYGDDWKRYCNKVKYVLIPKIY